ncbi:MAG: hypothetical protein D6748_05655 [Calditrichaeota bacterium]|nr:MAG: hypothetical protein D6748_05655 [Calditrichota bacterium]
MKISKADQEKEYQQIKKLLDDIPKMSRENLFAVYGYIAAFFEMGYLSREHLEKLLKQLPLTADDTDEILL